MAWPKIFQPLKEIIFKTYFLLWSIYEIIHIWTVVVDESKKWSSQLIFQFKQLDRRSLRKSGIPTRDLHDTGAMLYQASYEATHWERGQFIEFISSREEWNDVKHKWNNSLNCGCRWNHESDEN